MPVAGQLITEDDLVEIERRYWDDTYKEIAEDLGCGVNTVRRRAQNVLDLPAKSEQNRIEYNHGVEIERVLYHLHHDAKMSVNKMSDALDVSRRSLDRWFQDTNVHKRGQSEAEQLKWDQMSAEERDAQVEAAHEAVRNNYAEFRTSYRGYETWRDGTGDGATVKHHRLLATLLVNDIKELEGKHVHHKNNIPWDNRKENIEPMEPADHRRHHTKDRRDSETGRFV